MPIAASGFAIGRVAQCRFSRGPRAPVFGSGPLVAADWLGTCCCDRRVLANPGRGARLAGGAMLITPWILIGESLVLLALVARDRSRPEQPPPAIVPPDPVRIGALGALAATSAKRRTPARASRGRRRR